MSDILDRDALYYPYIQIHDVNWLKATLLCFPQVRRMVPSWVKLREQPDIAEFRKVKGPRNQPLLVEEDVNQSAVYQAQQRLLAHIKDHEDFLIEKYSEDHSQRANLHGTFQIHQGKMHDLLEYCKENKLAWNMTPPEGAYPGEWIAVHPNLGKAIMSTMALAIANDKGLEIVTPSSGAHHAIVSNNDADVFDDLIGKPKVHGAGTLSDSDKADDLAEMVMTTTFDLDRLTAEQIAELLKEGKGLQEFKTMLGDIAKKLPYIPNPTDREERLQLQAQEVIENWENYKKSLPRFALDALVDATKVEFPAISVPFLLAGANLISLAVGAGLAVGILAHSGMKIWRQYQDNVTSPYQYLSRIEKAGAVLVAPPAHM
ncbi:MAG: hypothetical protein NPIRA03_06890 [Nitrospirales bacterium]|nr:MAG: hypothetical protein NPIRA03_06890 [Nitrospirales bacterium]